MMSMNKRDRSVLGGLVVAMIVGVGGSLALAASCLGRDQAHREDDPVSRFPEDQSARTSAGGVPGEEADEPVGTTRVTAAELPPAGAAAATTNAPLPAMESEIPAPHTHSIETTPRPAPASTPPPAPVPTTGGATTQDGGAAAPAAPATGREAGAAADSAGADAGRSAESMLVPTPYENIGAGNFISEPPRFGASAWEANPEAGAGPFTTERNVPDNPGP